MDKYIYTEDELRHLSELNDKLHNLFECKNIPVYSIKIPTEIDFKNKTCDYPTNLIIEDKFPCALIGNLLHSSDTEIDLYVGVYSDSNNRKEFAEFWSELNDNFCVEINDDEYKVSEIRNKVSEQSICDRKVLACEMDINCWLEE